MLLDGVQACGIDASPEQVAIARSSGLPEVELGDFHIRLRSTPAFWDAIVATDVLEHLTKQELLCTMDDVHWALKPGGRLIARVPNAVSPVGGAVMYGDLTHETWFTAQSAIQLAKVAGFSSVDVFACTPAVHGVKSFMRAVVWSTYSGVLKLGLAAETGRWRGHVVTQNLIVVAHKMS
jgi:SAM-dependent methyltransferase